MPPARRLCRTEVFYDHAPGAQGHTRLVLAHDARAARNPALSDRFNIVEPPPSSPYALNDADGALVPAINASYNLHIDQPRAAQQG